MNTTYLLRLLSLLLPVFVGSNLFGQYTPTESPQNEGGSNIQVTMPPGYSIYKILRPPYDSITGNVVGTFLNGSGQTTSSSDTFFFNPNSSDYFGTFYVDWNGTDASTGVVTEHTSTNGGSYLAFVITSTNDPPVLYTGTTNANNSDASKTYNVNEGDSFICLVNSTDADGGTPNIAISGGNDSSLFSVVGGQIQFNSSSGFDYEFKQDNGSDNTYEIEVTATDSNNTTDTQSLSIVVADTNDKPEIVQGNSDLIVTIDEDESPTTWAIATGGAYALTVSDVDSQNFTWNVSSPAVNGLATITGNNNNCTVVYVPDPDIWGTDTSSSPVAGQVGVADKFTVSVDDNEGGTDSIVFRVKINPVDDDDPIITFPAHSSISENDTNPISLTATDLDQGAFLTWALAGGNDSNRLSLTTGGVLTFVSSDDVDFEANASSDSDSNFTFSATVTDNLDQIVSRDFSISVIDVNEPPVIDQGESMSVVMYEDNASSFTVTLSATDPDTNSSTAQWGSTTWSLLNSPTYGNAIVSGTGSSPASLSYSPNSEYSGMDSFTVKVQDSEYYDTIDINVTVKPSNDPPVFSSSLYDGNSTVFLQRSENSYGDFQVAATDPDGGSISYQIHHGDDKEAFEINATTGWVKFLSPLPDYEKPTDSSTDGNNTYKVTVAATDSNGSSYQNFTIQVINAYESAVFTSPSTYSASENQTAVGTVSVTDVDVGDAHTYSILTGLPDDGSKFEINATSGSLSFISAQDFEANSSTDGNNTYDFVVRATDSGGISNDLNVTVNLLDDNDQPSLSGNSALFNLPESAAAGTVIADFNVSDQDVGQAHVWSFNSGGDNDYFGIEAGTGKLSLLNPLDFDSPSDANRDAAFELSILATDVHSNPLPSSPFNFQVKLTDVNEAPYLQAGSFSPSISMTEDNASSFVSPSWVAVDPETNSSNNIKWFLVDQTGSKVLTTTTSKSSVVSIGNLDGSISYVPATDANRELNGSEYLTVVFQDAGGLEANQTIQIDVSSVNDAPEITAPAPFNSSISHPENTVQVIDFNASDYRDQGAGATHFTEEQFLTWNVSGTDAALFEISTLGVLNFLSAPLFNGSNSQANRYSLNVTVSDTFGGSTTYPLVINVQNSPEAPVLNGSPPTVVISEDENPISWESVWTELNVTDPDSGNMEWFIPTNQNGTKGTATVQQYTGAVDYVPALNQFGADSFTVLVKDVDDMNVSVLVKVEITPVNDAPVISDSNGSGYSKQILSWAESTPVSNIIRTFQANDGNDSEYASSSFTWGLSSTDADDFTLDSSGNLRFKSTPDYENPTDADADNLYDLNVTVTDDSNVYSSYTLFVRVTNVNEPPVFTSLSGQASANVSISENQTSVYTAVASASNNSSPISYLIGGNGADDALFQIEGSTGDLSFKTAPDFENSKAAGLKNLYVVEVNATDNLSFSTQTVTVQVLDVNEAPIFDTTKNYSLSHAENNESFSLNLRDYVIDDNNASVFEYSIDTQNSKLFVVNAATGMVTLGFIPDFENPANTNLDNNYSATFKVKDGTHEISQQFNVEISDMDDPPSLVGTNFTQISVNENNSKVSAFEVVDQDSAASLLDLLMVVENQSIEFSLNSGSSANRFSDGVGISNLANASFAKAADFDRDGDHDVMLMKKNSSSIEILNNDGSGVFTSVLTLGSSSSVNSPSHAVIDDLNEDGYPDLVVAMKGSNEVSFFRNSATTNSISFDPPVSVGTGISGVTHVQAGDLDADGDLDVMAIAENTNEILWYKNEGPLAFHSNASSAMSFSLGGKLQTDQLLVNGPRSAALGDVDQDGDLDVVVASSMDGNFTNFINDGNGSFGTPKQLYKELNSEAQLVNLVDLNSDNKLDLVLVTKNPNKLGVMLQTDSGLGVFNQPNFFYTANFFVNSFEVGDLDKDGDLDIVAASSSDSNVYWFANDGLGQFTIDSEKVSTSRESIVSLALADFDQSNTVLAFEIDSTSADSDAFVFRPEYSGNLFFKQNPDYESRADENKDNQYEIVIKVSDQNNPNDLNSQLTQKVVINLNNLYEPPQITSPSTGSSYYTSIKEHTFYVVDVNSTNDEALYEKTTYSIAGGLDAQHFSIDSTSGVLSFITEPDFELPVDDVSDGNNSYVVIVRASDDGPGIPPYSEQTIYVDITNGNDAPILNFKQNGVSYVLNEDTSQTVSLNSSDINASDPEGGPVVWSIDRNPTIGTASISGNNLLYSPNTDANGSDSVVLQVTDDNNLSATVTINFSINPLNDLPVISTNKFLTHPENSVVVTTLSANDPDNDILSWSLVGGPDASSFTLTQSGVLSFVNPPDYENADSNDSDLDYIIQTSVSDGNASVDGNFTISVSNVNDLAPIINNLDSNASTLLSVNENSSFVLDLNVSELESDSVSYSFSGGADYNKFNLTASGTLSFQSLPDFENPSDSDSDNLYLLDVNVSDGLNSSIRSIVVAVQNLNEDPPTILNPTGSISKPLSHPENQAYVLEINASDDLNEKLTFSISGGMDASFFDLNASSGILSFKPENLPDYEKNQSSDGNGIYEVQIQASDGVFPSNRTFYIETSDINEFPQVFPNEFTVNEDEKITLNLSVFDPEGDPFEQSFSRTTSNGQLTTFSSGYQYQPNPNFNGIDEFAFTVSDYNKTSELKVTITVLPVDDPPSAVEDHFNYDDPDMKTIPLNVIENDSNQPDDNGTEPIFIVGWNESWPGQLSDNIVSFDSVSQNFTFTPPANYIGPISFQYELSEGDLNAFGTATIHLNRSPEIPNWRYLSKFGYFAEKSYPWLLHNQLGWIYLSETGGENTATWMWSEQIGWFWTGNDHFPHLYSDELKKWYFWELESFYPQDDSLAAMHDYSTDKKISLFDFQLLRARAKLTFLDNVTSVAQFIQANQFFSTAQKQSIIGELIFKGNSDTLNNLIEGSGK